MEAPDAPYEGYTYTELTKDLHSLITELDLQDVILVGFLMGGGEVVRYFTDYGTDRIAKAALISSIMPLVPQKDDNPGSVPQENLDGILESVKSDRVTFLGDFLRNFFYSKALIGTNKNDVSEQDLHYA
ncbi:MAG: non-heme chloroperoxidase [Spirosomataceae bacterium]